MTIANFVNCQSPTVQQYPICPVKLSSLLTSSAAAAVALLLLLPFFEVSLYPAQVLWVHLGAVVRGHGGDLRRRNEIKAWGHLGLGGNLGSFLGIFLGRSLRD